MTSHTMSDAYMKFEIFVNEHVVKQRTLEINLHTSAGLTMVHVVHLNRGL